MKTLRLLLTLAALWGAQSGLAADFPADEPLPSDPRNLTGRLDNGVTWIYRRHDNPPGKMALQMHVRSGSLNETDPQQGLAHFLEHMVFNGTTHFPPGKLVPYFESIGMKFGPHLNAFTSFDQTVYQLFTPDTQAAQVDKALMVLSDYAFGALLLEFEIKKERGIILEELRTGLGPDQRIRDELWPQLFAGSRFAQRLPIGKAAIIEKAGRPEFEDYYRTWYRPQDLTVVLVGDAPHEDYLPLIKKHFGDRRAEAPARPQEGAGFHPFTTERALVVTDPEKAGADVSLLAMRAARPPITNLGLARVELLEYLGTWILNRRFDDRVKAGTASYRGAAGFVSAFFHDGVLAGVEAEGEPADWGKMLAEQIAEVKRAVDHGFTARELALARSEILAGAERAVRTESTRDAHALISEIVTGVNDREPVLSAQQELEVYQRLFPTIALADVNATFKERFDPGAFAHVVTMSSKPGVDVPSRDTVEAAAKVAWAASVEPPADEPAITSLLAVPPVPGAVVESTTDGDLGVTSAWLTNGVRVHHRFMDYKKDAVLVSVSLAGGRIEETATNAGVTEIATLVVNEAATSKYSSARIRDYFTGKNINVGAAAADDTFAISVTGSPKDLEAGLELVFALLTDGRLEESAFRNWRLTMLRAIEERERSVQFKAAEARQALLTGNDPRLVPIGRARVEALAAAEGQAWFDRLARQAPIEVAVVGDLPWDQARPLVERYLGSLAARDRSAARLDPLRRIARPEGPAERTVEVDTVTPRAIAMSGFFAANGSQVEASRALELARNIVSSRLVKAIREDAALVYSIDAAYLPSWSYPELSRFGTGAPCDPGKALAVTEEANKLFAAFAASGPSAEELANAKKQVANELDTELREPAYWWDILRNYDLHHRDLAVEKRIAAEYEACTSAQVHETFRKYFDADASYRVIAKPKAPASGTTPPGAAPPGP